MANSSSTKLRVAVIGNGPVGVHFVNELLTQTAQAEVHLFGDEPYDPYNRVALSQLLYGEKSVQDLELPLVDSDSLHCHWHTRIDEIDTRRRSITDNQGVTYLYDVLVLATGSRAHMPSIPGVHMTGVYSFRNMKDAQALLSRRVGSRHTVVLGGGLLGIETARAMRRMSTSVTLIQHASWLMNRQLDEASARMLEADMAAEGIEVRTSTAVMAVDGRRRVEGVMLRDGKTLACDTVILATGIRPNIELAREAGIRVRQGIHIDDQLRTSAPNVFAIGECTEMNGEIFGLVAPGLEQAALLARRLANKTQEVYQQRALATRLKVLDTPVISIGQTGELHTGPDSRFIQYKKDGIHRSLHLERGRLIGASGVGAWGDQERLKDLIEEGGQLNIFKRLRFRLSGSLWGESEQILDHHIICNCRQVSAGELRACAAQGQALSCTGAGTVCGSCRPLLVQFDPQEEPTEPDVIAQPKGIIWQSLTGLVGMLLIALFLLTSPLISVAEQYTPNHISSWWTDSDKRQITGFTLLSLTLFSLLVSARKRISRMSWLSFSTWRGWHIVLTTLVLALLFLHTGQSDFQGVNQWLIVSFWSAAALGFIATLMSWREQASPGIGTKRIKRWAVFGHIVAFWPLPVLLSFHVLSVYWF